VWLGIAMSAVTRARAYVRQQARAKPGTLPPAALRLAEVSSMLQTMRTNVHDVASECEMLMKDEKTGALSSIAFALKMNNLKVSSSQVAVQIIHHALLICGIMGYKNDSKFAVGRHLRDAHSAALMVNNDRIYATNASMLLVLKDD
jgi:acyl-CoA dehydrogenase